MLFVLALGQVSPPQFPAEPMPTVRWRDFSSYLRREGFEFEATYPHFERGTLRRGGHSAQAVAEMYHVPTQRAVNVIAGLAAFRLSVNVHLGMHDAAAATRGVLPRHLLSRTLAFVPHPGHVATAFVDIDVRHLPTAAAFVESIKGFFDGVEAFAKRHGGRVLPAQKTSWTFARFPDDLTLDGVDFLLVGRLIHGWGWSAPERLGPDAPPSDRFAVVDGKLIWVSPPSLFGAPLTKQLTLCGRIREARILLPDPKRLQTQAGREQALTEDRYIPPMEIQEDIDFSEGLRIGDLRRRFQAFAHRVTKLRKNGA